MTTTYDILPPDAIHMFQEHPTLKPVYEFMVKKHKGQVRMGGLPYHTHPLAVAVQLHKKGYQASYLSAGLLHDIKEDTDATDEEILELTDEVVLNMVNELTKVKIKDENGKTIPFDSREYLSNMGYSTKMVKLSDRLHNLKSARVAPLDFQKRYLQETQDLYLDFSRGTDFHEAILDATNILFDIVNAKETEVCK